MKTVWTPTTWQFRTRPPLDRCESCVAPAAQVGDNGQMNNCFCRSQDWQYDAGQDPSPRKSTEFRLKEGHRLMQSSLAFSIAQCLWDEYSNERD